MKQKEYVRSERMFLKIHRGGVADNFTKIFFLSFFVLGFFALVGGEASAATYYVDCGAANDDGAGTTEGTAWKTIAKVNATLTGDQSDNSVLFKKDCTWSEQLTVPSSGTSGHPFTFGAYGTTGAKPIISGADSLTEFTQSVNTSEETGGMFTSGLETETDSFNVKFTSKTEANSNTVTVSSASDAISAGAKGAIITFAGTSATAEFSKNLGSNTKYFRFYFKLDSNFTADSGGKATTIGAIHDNGNNEDLVLLALYSDTGQTTKFHLEGDIRYPGYQTIFSGANDSIQRGVWYYAEIHYEKGLSTTVEFFLNNVSQGAVSGVNTNAYSPAGIKLGSINYNTMVPTNGSKIYFDNVKASTSTIGPFTLSSATTWEKAGVTAEPKTVIYNGNVLTPSDGTANFTNPNKWDWNANTLYVNVGGAPADNSVEAAARDNGIYGNNKNYITVDGLSIYGTNKTGIYALGQNWTVKNNTIKNLGGATGGWGQGIYVSGSNSLVQYNTISYAQRHGIWISDGSDNIIESNDVRNCWNFLNFGSSGWGAGIEASTDLSPATRTIIRNNFLKNNYLNIANDYARSSQIYSNILIDSYIDNIFYAHADSSYLNSIFNNTIIHSPDPTISNGGVGFGISMEYDALNGNYGDVRNNIIYITYSGVRTNAVGVAGVAIDPDALGVTEDYNMVYKTLSSTANLYKVDVGSFVDTVSDWRTAISETSYIGKGAHDIQSDSIFTNASGLFNVASDFTLQPTSPAINAGTSVGLTTDYAGNPIYGTPDIGAYEYQGNIPSGGGALLNKSSSRRTSNVSDTASDEVTLEEDDDLDSETEEAVQPSLPVSVFTFKRHLDIGDEGPDVVELQKILRSQGFFTHPTNTGYLGPVTAEAVKRYQTKNGIPALGIVGPLTLQKLNGEVRKQEFAEGNSSEGGLDLVLFIRLLLALGLIPEEKAGVAFMALKLL